MDALLSQLWPLTLFMLAVALLVRGLNRKRRREQVERNTTNAALRGMAYAAPTGDDASASLSGTHRFAGTTRGVKWSVETLYLTDQDTGGYSHSSNHLQNYTRWTAPQLLTDGGALLLMNLPKGVSAPIAGSPTGKSGFLAAMADRAAAAALQVFAGVTFGNARSNALPLSPQHRLPLGPDALGTAFVAFSDHPELLARLGPAAREHLLAERDKRIALLWDQQGLTLTWPSAHMAAEEVAICADYGTALVELLALH